MTMIMNEVLAALIDRLRTDPNLAGINIYNSLPQDQGFPYIRAWMPDGVEFDTKTSDGFRDVIRCDIWTAYASKGNKSVYELMQYVYEAMQNKPFTGLSLTSICLKYKTKAVFLEAENDLNHGVIDFEHLYSE